MTVDFRGVEARLVRAAWTMRRLPDKEAGWIYGSVVAWPDTQPDRKTDYSKIKESITPFEARKAIPPTAAEVDDWEPAINLIRLLPDLTDRNIVWWASWHQCGEVTGYIPWAKVRQSCEVDLSRWSLKRRYQASLELIAKHLSQKDTP